jgi:hypothetical protein
MTTKTVSRPTVIGIAPPKSGSAPEPTRSLTPTGRYRFAAKPLMRLPHLNGRRHSDLEFEDQCFLRKLKAWGLARVVDRVVQIRQPSDVGYTIPYSEAVATARIFGFEVGA